MIEILKHGNIPHNIGTCLNCGCEIRCDSSDLMEDLSTSVVRNYVYCPECLNKIYIN